MKKVVLLAFISVYLLSTLVFIRFVAPVKAEPKTIYVDAGNVGDPSEDGSLDHPFDKIQEGVDAASPGDKVFVYGGTYYELDIVLDKNDLSLVGENRDDTIIDGQGYGSILKINNAHNVTIAGFTIRNSPGANGIRLYYSTKSTISNNIITKCQSGIYSVFSNGNVIENNQVSDNYAGIILSSFCRENRISNNEAINNTLGIYLSNHAHHNDVRNNKIIQNTYGVSISLGNNSIFANEIINNDVGIYEMGPTQGYRIFRNNFINNTKQIDLSNQSVNIWDNGLEGNYWSDYNGTDFNRDGIGDIPYIINGNNTDRHPLMGTFSDFPVTLEEQTYHVTTICNSTVSAFQFDQVNKIIRFNVTGEEGIGFCRVCIAYDLMPPPHTVTIDDGKTPVLYYNRSIYDNSTHRWIYFTYEHSTHARTRSIRIETQQEKAFPTWIVAAIIIALVGALPLVYFAKFKKRSEKVKK